MIRDRSGKQPLNRFPERVYIHSAMQFEQRLLQRRIDHWFPSSDKQTVSPHVPLLPRTSKKDYGHRENVQQIAQEKLKLKLPRDHQESHKVSRNAKIKKKGTKV